MLSLDKRWYDGRWLTSWLLLVRLADDTKRGADFIHGPPEFLPALGLFLTHHSLAIAGRDWIGLDLSSTSANTGGEGAWNP